MLGRIHSLESFGTVDGPGIRFVSFMQGCPLRCLYCHNPDTWNLQGRCQYELTPEELLEETVRYRNFIKNGGVTVTGGEPLLQAPFVREYFRLCNQEGLHTALDTSGAIVTEQAFSILDYTRLLLLDIKTMNSELHHKLTGAAGGNSLAFLEEADRRGIPIWIRHVVVPGLTDNEDDLHALGQYVSTFQSVEQIEVLPYHVMGVYKYRQMGISYPLEGIQPLPSERLLAVKEILKQYKPVL